MFEGHLRDAPLPSLLELIKNSRQRGHLFVDAALPLTLALEKGQVVSATILDYEGLEGLFTYPLHLEDGMYRFEPSLPQAHRPLMPFDALLSEWARHNDEWQRLRQRLDSPSHVLDPWPNARPAFALFDGKRSVRAVAKLMAQNDPKITLLEVAKLAADGLEQGDLAVTYRYAWFSLRIQHADAGRVNLRGQRELTSYLDGTMRLGELIENQGFFIGDVREYLIEAIRSEVVQVPGRGWLLADLLWELGR
jgi:Domain of unknown function (DUF4388)